MIREINDLNIINSFLNKFNVNVENIGVYTKYFVYTVDNSNIGFISYDVIYDRIELNYIYVEEEYRKKQIASKLLSFMIDEGKKIACSNITLEVNENNIAAKNLYLKNGFKIAAKRKNYYGSEDGLLLIREMI